MNPAFFFLKSHGSDRKRRAGFTLIEMIVVIAIMVTLMVLVMPSFTNIRGGTDFTSSAYNIAGALDQARAYAMANNTYVWVGFSEEDGSKPSTTLGGTVTSGTGRVIVATVASTNGSRYTSAVALSATTSGVTLVTVNKVLKLDNLHLFPQDPTVTLSPSNPYGPARAAVPLTYQVGSTSFTSSIPSVFTYPLTVNASRPSYQFSKIIEFNPLGEASKIYDTLTLAPQDWLEIAVQPTHGNVVDKVYAGTGGSLGKPAAAVFVEGMTGRVEVFRP